MFIYTLRDILDVAFLIIIPLAFLAVYVRMLYRQFRCKHEKLYTSFRGTRCGKCGKEFQIFGDEGD